MTLRQISHKRAKSLTDHLDLRGYQCPLPVLKTRNFLRKLRVGDQVWINTDDPLAGVDIPHFCNEFNQTLVQQKTGEANSLLFLIERCGEKL